MENTQKILFLARTSNLGGAELSLLDLLVNLNKDSIESIVVIPDKQGLFYNQLMENNIKTVIKKMAFIRKSYNPFLILWFLVNVIAVNFYFLSLLKKDSIRLVVCNSFQDSIFVGLPCKITKTKMIIYIKNILDSKFKKVIRAKLCDYFAHKIIASSKKNAKDYTDFSKNREKITVIYDGINIDKLRKVDTSTNPFKDYGGAKLMVVNIGNISELKGQKLLVEALNTKKIKNLDIKIFFIGEVFYAKDEKYKNDIINFIMDNNLERKVFFLGFQTDINKFIYQSDLLVHCPVAEEGLGMVILEAFALGKIVIGTNLGGIPEIIKDGFNGLLSKPDMHDLASKIYYVYNNINSLEHIKSNAKLSLEKDFDLKAKLIKTEKLFQSIMGI